MTVLEHKAKTQDNHVSEPPGRTVLKSLGSRSKVTFFHQSTISCLMPVLILSTVVIFAHLVTFMSM